MRLKITWMEHGTNNAACIGLDEIVTLRDCEIDPVRQAEMDAEYHGKVQGVDLEKYGPLVEILTYETPAELAEALSIHFGADERDDLIPDDDFASYVAQGWDGPVEAEDLEVWAADWEEQCASA